MSAPSISKPKRLQVGPCFGTLVVLLVISACGHPNKQKSPATASTAQTTQTETVAQTPLVAVATDPKPGTVDISQVVLPPVSVETPAIVDLETIQVPTDLKKDLPQVDIDPTASTEPVKPKVARALRAVQKKKIAAVVRRVPRKELDACTIDIARKVHVRLTLSKSDVTMVAVLDSCLAVGGQNNQQPLEWVRSKEPLVKLTSHSPAHFIHATQLLHPERYTLGASVAAAAAVTDTGLAVASAASDVGVLWAPLVAGAAVEEGNQTATWLIRRKVEIELRKLGQVVLRAPRAIADPLSFDFELDGYTDLFPALVHDVLLDTSATIDHLGLSK